MGIGGMVELKCNRKQRKKLDSNGGAGKPPSPPLDPPLTPPCCSEETTNGED